MKSTAASLYILQSKLDIMILLLVLGHIFIVRSSYHYIQVSLYLVLTVLCKTSAVAVTNKLFDEMAAIYVLYLSWELVSVLDWDDSVLDRDRSPTQLTQFWTQLTQFWTETIRTVSVLDQDNQTISVLDWDNIRTVSVLDQDNQTISVLDWVVSVEDRYITLSL